MLALTLALFPIVVTFDKPELLANVEYPRKVPLKTLVIVNPASVPMAVLDDPEFNACKAPSPTAVLPSLVVLE